MYTAQELLAAGLAALIGLVVIVRPRVALRIAAFAFGGGQGRRGPYGQDPEFEDRTALLARGAGVLVIGLGLLVLALPHL